MPKKDAGAGPISAQAQQDLVSDGIENYELPRSVVMRIARSVVPDNTKLQKDTGYALLKGSVVFINYLAATAHDVAVSKQHKSISASDVIKAMELIGFGDMTDYLQTELNIYRDNQKSDKSKKSVSAAGASHKKTPSASASAATSAAAPASKGKPKAVKPSSTSATAKTPKPSSAAAPAPAAAAVPAAVAREPVEMEVDGEEPAVPAKKADVEEEKAEALQEDDDEEEDDEDDEEDEDDEDDEEEAAAEDKMEVEEEELRKDAKGLDAHDNTGDDDS